MSAFPEHFPNDGDLERYVRRLADLCGLRDWKIELEDEHPGEGCMGHVNCTYGRKMAQIRLAEHETIEDLRHTIVHELIHTHLDPTRLPIANIRNILGQSLYDSTDGAHTDAVEYATDAIASVLAPLLPLPMEADE